MKIWVCEAALLLLIGGGCDTRRDILDDKGTWVRVQLDWSATALDPARATVYFYPDRCGLSPAVLKTNERYDSILLRRSHYQVLAFNETPTGFDHIAMRGLEAFTTAEVYANPLSVTTQRMVDRPAAAPDLIAVYPLDGFELTATMIRYNERPLLLLKPRHLTVPVTILVHVKGVDNAAEVGSAGLMSGLAGGVMCASGTPTLDPVTHAFVLGNRTFDTGSFKNGTMSAFFNSFDLVDLDGYRNVAVLRFRLRDNSIFTVERDVTTLIRRYPTAYGVRLEVELGLGTDSDPEIVLPEVPDASDPGAGFDAVVDPWGDEERIDVEI